MAIIFAFVLISTSLTDLNKQDIRIQSLNFKTYSVDTGHPYSQERYPINETMSYEVDGTTGVGKQPTHECKLSAPVYSDSCIQGPLALPMIIFALATNTTTNLNFTGTAGREDNIENNNSLQETPDMRCLFDPDLPNCSPDELGHCPGEFAINDDDRCIPIVGCPEGYHKVEDDESGRCYSDEEGCPTGMIFNPRYGDCEYKNYVCRDFPNLKECGRE